ncbi:hypothetical protein SLH49_19430 [Cognatiyoonia sp. IB215446]|uniref:hypothetical protein n=1 Tax=Cognatiyoonia sp. IB215446 TaxID=3097355 RepID=UPI002A0B84F0|nr:hypothetical protein [Cognatiyoonia sp. IB215446]MDX8350170.1 hypothetical protein [Cognatiyoonia sp. IB215446]
MLRFTALVFVVSLTGCIDAGDVRTSLPSRTECVPISFCTYNFGALTPKVEPAEYSAKFRYIAEWPGVIIDSSIRDEGGNGYVVPGFATKESGAGIWWYWMMKRGNEFKGYDPQGSVTLRQLAMNYAGSTDPSSASVQNYFIGYSSHAPKYFLRDVGLDDEVSLTSPDNVWNLARTMFHHEAGMRITDDVLSRSQFEKGISLAEAHIAGQRVSVEDFIAE